MIRNSSKKQLQEFGLILGLGIPILLGWIFPTIHGHGIKYWTLWIGVSILIISTLKPKFLSYAYEVWMLLGYVLGWINSRIILGLVFVFLLQPIAFFMRASGYDPLRIKKINKKTYREEKNGYKIDLTRIF